MADPLSIPTTILPQSTFDPVQWSKERRQELLNEQSEKRARYNEAWNSVSMPSDLNRNVQAELIARRNSLVESGASSMAEGIDVTDITHPKYGIDAMKFREQLNQLNLDASKTLALDKYLREVRTQIAKDDKNVINRDATIKNIQIIQNAKSLKDIDDFLASKGDNIIEVNRQTLDVNRYIADNLKNYGIKAMEKDITTIENGKEVTRGFNELDPKELKNAMSGMYYADPKLREEIKFRRENDPTDLRGGTDVEYFMERYGNPRLRQQVSERVKPYESKSVKEPDKPKYQPTSEPVKTNIFFGKGGNKTYQATGTNVLTFDQSKSMNIQTGLGAIDIDTGEKIVPKQFIDFTPINTAEYYVTTVPTKRGKGFDPWPAGTILKDDPKSIDNKNVVKKRFVQGVFTEGSGQKEVKKTILIPYENIKNELDVAYEVGKDIKDSPTETKLQVGSKTYSKQDLKNMGYSEEKINNAIKDGKIKVM